MRTLLFDCPKTLRPRWNVADGYWQFCNGSEIHIAGCNNGHADDSRGQRSHLNVIDEAGFVDELEYLLKSVLLPQTLTTGGVTVLISTPPKSPAHELIPILRQAESEGAYFKWVLDQTTHLTQAAKDALVSEMGGRDSAEAQRELWCEIVTDPARAVVPEFTEERAKALVRPVPPPTYETPLVSLDVGFEDYSHELFGYYHFRTATLRIQKETRLRRMRTDQLAAETKRIEAELWPEYKPESTLQPSRVSDTDLILLADLGALHKLHFVPTAKDEKEAMVNELRLWVQNGRIQIDPSCVHLVRQMKSAIWNKQRTQFERTAADGHFDGVDALIYMLRNAPIHVNPYPPLDPSITVATHQINPSATVREEEKAIRSIFGRVH